MGSGAERHRAVDEPVVLEQAHRCDAVLCQLGPDLPNPRLRIALGEEPGAGVPLDLDRAPVGVLQPPPPRPLGGGGRTERRRLPGQHHDSRTEVSTNGGFTSWKISRRPRTSTPTWASSATITGIS